MFLMCYFGPLAICWDSWNHLKKKIMLTHVSTVVTAHASELIKLGLEKFMLKSLVLEYISSYKCIFSLRRRCNALG